MLFTPPTLAYQAVRATAVSDTIVWSPELQIFSDGCAHYLGTGIRVSDQTDVRTASGWLSVRRLLTFMAGRLKALGTELLSSFETMVRAVTVWLSARPFQILSNMQESALGTAWRPVVSVDSCSVPGWLSEQASTGLPSNAGTYHLPVFPLEIQRWMGSGPNQFIIDGTLGGGGHSELFLQSGATVLGIDRDPEAVSHARIRLAQYGNRFSTWEGNFSRLKEIPEIQNGKRADGLLLDLGVSSRQLDSASRGFSFMREGPLDMRMGPSSPYTAAQILNDWSEADLTRILFEFGEEPKARRIAAAIVKERAAKAFETTLQLADFIEHTIGRYGRTHPATRTFQAIRMAVNEELDSLATALAVVPLILKPGGRLLVVTFHSLEDRMVKRFLRHRSAPFIDDPGWPEPRPNPDFQFEVLSRKAILPSIEEISRNPRARSAKLRVARLLDFKP